MFKDLKTNKISSDILNSYTKTYLDEIRKYYGITKASSLKKADLAIKISDFIKDNLEDIISNHLNIDELNLLKSIINNGNKPYLINDCEINQLKSLKMLGISFPCLIEKNNSAIVPVDYLDKIKELIDTNSVEEKILYTNRIIKIVKGCLYHYGIININSMVSIVNTYLEDKLSKDSFIELMTSYFEKYDDLKIKNNNLYHKDVFNTESLTKLQDSKKDLDYKIFGLESILLYSDNSTLAWDEHQTHLFKYLMSTIHDMNKDDLTNIVNRCTIWIKNNFNIPTILNYLNTYVHFKDQNQMIHITPYIKDMINTTSLWGLKGHCNIELTSKKNSFNYVVSNKIGRNDPCPCGSNKKYKKCCGK